MKTPTPQYVIKRTNSGCYALFAREVTRRPFVVQTCCEHCGAEKKPQISAKEHYDWVAIFHSTDCGNVVKFAAKVGIQADLVGTLPTLEPRVVPLSEVVEDKGCSQS